MTCGCNRRRSIRWRLGVERADDSWMSEFDEAPRNPADPFAQGSVASDLICTIPWVGHGFHAIEVYAAPSLLDRAEELCGTVGSWAATSDDADSMVSTVMA